MDACKVAIYYIYNTWSPAIRDVSFLAIPAVPDNAVAEIMPCALNFIVDHRYITMNMFKSVL